MRHPRRAASGGPRTAVASPVSRPVALVPLRFAVEHMLLVIDLDGADETACAVLIAAVALATGDLALGFIAGWAVLVLLRRTRLHRLELPWPGVARRPAPAPEPAVLKAP